MSPPSIQLQLQECVTGPAVFAFLLFLPAVYHPELGGKGQFLVGSVERAACGTGKFLAENKEEALKEVHAVKLFMQSWAHPQSVTYQKEVACHLQSAEEMSCQLRIWWR